MPNSEIIKIIKFKTIKPRFDPPNDNAHIIYHQFMISRRMVLFVDIFCISMLFIISCSSSDKLFSFPPPKWQRAIFGGAAIAIILGCRIRDMMYDR